MIEAVASADLAGHLTAVEQGPCVGCGLGEPVEALPEATAEIDAELLVLVPEPGGPEAHDRAAAADVIDRRHGLDR